MSDKKVDDLVKGKLGCPMYVWEVMRWIPDPLNEAKQIRCSAIIGAHKIEDVWEWLAADRADAKTEIESIVRAGPIVAILDSSRSV